MTVCKNVEAAPAMQPKDFNQSRAKVIQKHCSFLEENRLKLLKKSYTKVQPKLWHRQEFS